MFTTAPALLSPTTGAERLKGARARTDSHSGPQDLRSTGLRPTKSAAGERVSGCGISPQVPTLAARLGTAAHPPASRFRRRPDRRGTFDAEAPGVRAGA